MRLRPFFSYYGSKYRIIEKYPAPVHDTIIEPFAGSAQYATRYPHKKVHLYDLDENVVVVWDYLIHVSETEIKSISLDFEHVDDTGYTYEQKILCGFLIGSTSNWPRKTISPQFKKQSWIQRIASQIQYIRHWKITHSSYENISNHLSTWFIDPPYQNKGIYYRKSSKNIDYSHLATWSKSRNGSIIVCENDGASWLQFKKLCTTKGSKNTKSTEAIYTNIPNRQLRLF